MTIIAWLGLLAFWSLSTPLAAREPTVIQFWAMGREGEVVKSLVTEFEARHPDIRVKVQQIPWSAAHEKLLTAYAGDAMPDLFQLGNTWIPEFVALRALEPFGKASGDADFFAGTAMIREEDGALWCLPWYVDTRVLFYRRDLLAEAGWSEPPRDWQGWLAAMEAIRRLPGGDRYGMLLPMNEWQLPVILGLQQGAGLLRDQARYGDFRSPRFRRGLAIYLSLFRRRLAPAFSQSQVANLYQEFARGYFAVYLSGPWNLGEFRRRLPMELQDRWSTTPLPSFDARSIGLSVVGGASLALSRGSRHPAEAESLARFLAEPERQLAFYQLSGDLPSRRAAWTDPLLAEDEKALAFRRQLDHVGEIPKIPEWERIAAKLAAKTEQIVRGEVGEDQGLEELDREVDQILEKRRWLMAVRGRIKE